MLFSTLITFLLSLFIGIPITAVVLAFARVHENWEGRAFCGIAGFFLRLCGSCWVNMSHWVLHAVVGVEWGWVVLGAGISCDSRAFIVVIVCGGEGGVGRVLDEGALTGGLRLFDPTGLYVF